MGFDRSSWTEQDVIVVDEEKGAQVVARRLAWVVSRLLLLALVLSPLAPGRGQAQAPTARYRALVDEALRESASGRWDEARALFRAAHEEMPNARTLRGIGMASFELRDYAEAYRALAASLVERRRPLEASQRAEVTALLERAAARIARYTLPALPEGARVAVDGVVALRDPEGRVLVPLGRHRIEVETPSGPVELPVVVDGGEVATLQVPSAPPPEAPVARADAGRGRRIAGASTLGVGAAVVAIGTTFFVLGRHDAARVEDAPRGTEWGELEAAYARAPRRISLGIGMLAGGAVAIGVGTISLVRGAHAERTVDVRVGPASIAWRMRW